MNRFLVLSAAILLASQVELSAGPVTSITVSGQMTNGNTIQALCKVSSTGAITGSGVLSGTNPQNGYKFKYYFTISKGTTAQGSLILTGKIISNGPDVTLTAAVPSGPVVFTYIVNGNANTMTGTGSVTVK